MFIYISFDVIYMHICPIKLNQDETITIKVSLVQVCHKNVHFYKIRKRGREKDLLL